jgi:hypothetical protein
VNALGTGYYFIMNDSIHANDQRRADEWRRMHQRPDALPLPEAAPRENLAARIASRLPVIGRVVAGRA